MKQLTQSEVRKNGKVYKNVSSPATEGTMKQVTDIVEKDGTFSISTDGGKTYSPAGGDVPEALPQEAEALASGSLPTDGWNTLDEGWKENTLPASRSWISATYGNGKYVAVAFDSSAGAYSTDGITWTEMIMPAQSYWRSVAYGNGKYVAVAGSSDKGAYSTDGTNWTETTLTANISWYGVTYGDGKFVVVANAQQGAYSTDGITWVAMTMPTSRDWEGITYGNGKYVAVAYNSRYGAYSMDGISWTEFTLPASRNWRNVAYGDGKFVAVADNSDKGAYSTDGISWTEMSMPASGEWSVAYGNGKFVAVAGGNGAYSTDGINWSSMSMPASRNWHSVTYGNGKYVAVAWNSTNGAYWKAAADVTFAISDTTITANSDILMELTDEGGVKAYSMEAGKMTVIRDTVPTQPIPYTYKVKQTNASGQFTLVNHFVPSIPESPTSLPVTYKKVSGSLPTSGWESTNVSWTGNVTSPANYYYLRFVTKIAGSYATNEIFYKTTYDNLLKSATVKGTGNGPIGNSGSSDASTQTGDYKLYAEESNAKIHIVIYDNGNIYYSCQAGSVTGSYALTELSVVSSRKTYTISDTFITANTSVKMYLNDEGGVKAYSKANGKITVIRDTVPTTAIPYEYEVEQTSAEGLFEVINAYVPTVPSKTSDLTNDSGFLTKNNIVAGDNVTVTDENGNVKISVMGGGSGGVTYTKLTGSVDFTTTAYTDDPYFLGQNAATWSENSAIGNKALTSTTDIGLIIGNSYTMVVNIQGTNTMFTAKAEDGNTYGLQGSKVLWFRRENISSDFIIYDHCNIANDNIQAGNGCIFVANLSSDITIADINYFSGNRGVITPVTITNSAIKINSTVTMYINSSLVVSGTKTDGGITLTASTEGSVSYEMEILNTSTEGLFEVINAYVPDVPTKTSQLENDSGFITSNDIPTIPTKTSELTNDSNFAKTTEANTWTGEQTFSNENGIKTNRVHNLNGNAWYDFDGTNDRLGSLATPTIVRTSEARPKAEVPSGSTTAIKELALLEDVPGAGEWVSVTGETATLTQAGTYQVVLYGSGRNVQSIIYWDGSTAAEGIYSTVVDLLESRPVMVSRFPQITAEGVISFGWVSISQSVQGDWLESNTTVSGFKYRKIN